MGNDDARGQGCPAPKGGGPRRTGLARRLFVVLVVIFFLCLVESSTVPDQATNGLDTVTDSAQVSRSKESLDPPDVAPEDESYWETNDEEEEDDYDEEEVEGTPVVITEHERLSSLLGDFTVEMPDGDEDPADPEAAAAWYLDQLLDTTLLRQRLANIFSKARTPTCRRKIATHLGYFVAALGKEENMPFAKTRFRNECPEPVYEDWTRLPPDMHIGMIQNRTYQPPRNEALYIGDPQDLRLLYAILTHDDAASTIRLIEALHEEGHIFVVHVDAKEASRETWESLQYYASFHDFVSLVPDPYRVSITWGGFSMVNATMQILQHAFGLLQDEQGEALSKAFDFHKVVHLASTSYPLASNTEIRHQLAAFPLDANFLHVIMKPSRPGLWNYFVECDDALHRIHHMPVLQNATAGVNLYTSSQWWIISREFAEYLARASPGTFVHQYLDYIQHVVVADETFFGTVIRHTTFCLKHHNRNFLHLQFDRWESDLPKEQRDEQKCMMKDPHHCGRSPTTMTVDYADILELSDDLFARKFVDSKDSHVKNIVDIWRDKREMSIRSYLEDSSSQPEPRSHGIDFEGHGVLIVARETANDAVPLCMALGDSSNEVLLIPCFHEWVVPNLLDKWETGGVVQQETHAHNRWEMSPCTSDGALERDDTTASLTVTPGNYSVTGPRCMLKQADGIRSGRCFDGDTGKDFPGGETLVYPCVHRWGQFLSVGDGNGAPKGSLFFHIPGHIVRMVKKLGREQHAYMCLSVGEISGDDRKSAEDNSGPVVAQPRRPLSQWKGRPVISIPCADRENVIEWAFVPYILDDFAIEMEQDIPPTAEETVSADIGIPSKDDCLVAANCRE